MSDFPLPLTPEEQLLISLCRLEFDRDQRSEIRDQMDAVTDWNFFVRMANEHGIIALCWYNITETGNSDLISESILKILHDAYLISLSRNTNLYDLLEEVLTLAEKENIKIVLLKGLALERTIYGNKGLRQMNDLDILVYQKDAIKLRKILLKNGYVSMPFISPLHEKILPSFGKHLPEMIKKGLAIEIHISLFDQADNSLTGELIEHAPSIVNNNHIVFIPEPQLHFLYLVKHLSKHESGGTSQLRLYADLIAMLSTCQDEMLTPGLFEYAGKAGINEALSEKLFILKTLWGAEYPQWVNEKAGKFSSDETINKFYRFLRFPVDPEIAEEPESLLKPMEDITGIFDKFLFVAGYLVPSLIFMKYRYGTRTRMGAIFYYPVRWGRLLRLLVGGRV